MKKMESIPKGWSYSSVADLFEFIPTNSLSREMMNYKVGNRSVFNIHYGDIHATFREQILDFQKHLPQIPVLINPPKKIDCEAFLKNGDLVIADVSEDYEGVGECIEIRGITGQKVLSGLHTIAARDVAGKTYAGFRAYLFKHPQVSKELKRIATGSKVYGISKSNLANLLLILPPLPEQRKIALILSTWDRAIEKTEQLIAQKQQLKKGLMQQLLTGKVRFKEFVKSNKVAKTKLRLIPEDWSEARLGNCVTKVGSGVTPSGGEAVYKSTGRVFVRSQNIGHGNLLLEDVAFIDEDTHQSFPSTEIFEFDVLLNITGASIGRCAVADSRVVGGNVNQHVCIIRVNQTLDPHFLAAYLLSEFGQNQIDSFQAGGNRQGLNFEQIKSFRVPLPSTREQRRISAVMRDTDREIEQLMGTQKKLQSQKKGLMQQLLTGKVRVKH